WARLQQRLRVFVDDGRLALDRGEAPYLGGRLPVQHEHVGRQGANERRLSPLAPNKQHQLPEIPDVHVQFRVVPFYAQNTRRNVSLLDGQFQRLAGPTPFLVAQHRAELNERLDIGRVIEDVIAGQQVFDHSLEFLYVCAVPFRVRFDVVMPVLDVLGQRLT